jgi:ABC-type nitrate/sulfonate/bicarbonate transport system substrate-binding protein
MTRGLMTRGLMTRGLMTRGLMTGTVARPVATLLVLLVTALLTVACGLATQRQAPLRQFHFMAGYKPQANLPFVGAYVAQQKGYFKELGLDVQISHATGQGEHLKLLLQGTVDVTTGEADAVLARRSDDLPVVSIATLGQRGQRAFAVQESSEVRSPKDFEGKTVGFKVLQTPDYLAMLAINGVDRSKITEVPVGFDPRILAAGKVDVYPVFESNEPDILARQGVPTRLFRPIDYGVPSLGLTYLTRQDLVTKDPAALEKFLKATLRGIQDAKENPEAATDIVMQFAQNEDRAHQLSMLKIELDMADGPASRERGIGWATREQWQTFHDTLLVHGGLAKSIDVTTAYTTKILEAVYKDGRLVWP